MKRKMNYFRLWRDLILTGWVGASWGLVMISNLLLAEEEHWAAPSRAAKKTNPIPVDEKSNARGKELYLQGCAACHGTKGKGDGAAAAALNPKPADHTSPMMGEESDGSLFWKITTGRGAMPAFEAAYSEEDRWNLVNFIRTLAPKSAVPVQPKGETKP